MFHAVIHTMRKQVTITNTFLVFLLLHIAIYLFLTGNHAGRDHCMPTEEENRASFRSVLSFASHQSVNAEYHRYVTAILSRITKSLHLFLSIIES
jgi:hypothetical protein